MEKQILQTQVKAKAISTTYILFPFHVGSAYLPALKESSINTSGLVFEGNFDNRNHWGRCARLSFARTNPGLTDS